MGGWGWSTPPTIPCHRLTGAGLCGGGGELRAVVPLCGLQGCHPAGWMRGWAGGGEGSLHVVAAAVTHHPALPPLCIWPHAMPPTPCLAICHTPTLCIQPRTTHHPTLCLAMHHPPPPHSTYGHMPPPPHTQQPPAHHSPLLHI